MQFMRKPILLLVFVLLAQWSWSQWYAEPFVGFRQDLNSPDFHQFNAGIQLAWKVSKYYELLFQIQRTLPSEKKYQQFAYTSNTALPLTSPYQKTMSPSIFNIGFGNRFFMAGKHSQNKLFAKVYLGYVYEEVNVSYTEIDKTNYAILNPDKSSKNEGLYIAGGFEFMRSIGNNRIFAAIDVSTPPIGERRPTYPYSYQPLSPFTINIVYSIALTKK